MASEREILRCHREHDEADQRNGHQQKQRLGTAHHIRNGVTWIFCVLASVCAVRSCSSYTRVLTQHFLGLPGRKSKHWSAKAAKRMRTRRTILAAPSIGPAPGARRANVIPGSRCFRQMLRYARMPTWPSPSWVGPHPRVLGG